MCGDRLVARIGRGIAECFGKQGANVVVNYRRSESEANEVADRGDAPA